MKIVPALRLYESWQSMIRFLRRNMISKDLNVAFSLHGVKKICKQALPEFPLNNQDYPIVSSAAPIL